jgi:hypothetical protein
METVIRNVGEIDSQDRQALEHLLGQTLRANQQLVIRIVNLQVQPDVAAETAKPNRNGGAALPEWCNVYAGFSDEEIAELEKTILTRADLSRPSE